MATKRCAAIAKATGKRCKNRVSGNRKYCPWHSGAKKTSRCWPGYEPVRGKKAYSKGSCRKVRRNPRSSKWKLLSVKKSPVKGKKLQATFKNRKTGRIKRTSFGATGYSDYTKHKDKDRKARYLARHKRRENWNNPVSAGALSRWILWNKTSRAASVADFKRRFGL